MLLLLNINIFDFSFHTIYDFRFNKKIKNQYIFPATAKVVV